MTVLWGDYVPIEVMTLDLVGYRGNGEFVILNPLRKKGRKFPDWFETGIVSECIRCTIRNHQRINRDGEGATLRDLNGEWYFELHHSDSKMIPLEPFSFFEIGNI